jgi:hypothetical protein
MERFHDFNVIKIRYRLKQRAYTFRPQVHAPNSAFSFAVEVRLLITGELLQHDFYAIPGQDAEDMRW